jgi:hypothetical protein
VKAGRQKMEVIKQRKDDMKMTNLTGLFQRVKAMPDFQARKVAELTAADFERTGRLSVWDFLNNIEHVERFFEQPEEKQH